MVDDHEATDARLEAARYLVRRDLGDEPEPDAAPSNAGAPTAHERALYVETVIQQAIRRGEFDDLPGAGKPIEGLGTSHDPDWWIRRKIQTEQLSGLGPPALRLRVEHAAFEAHVDAMTRAEDVRAYTEDFTRRVIEARRQLEGGPPVVTPTRDPEAEIAAWRERRAAAASTPPPVEQPPRRRWWRR
ncbi:DUF1992 domain-containing protein [Microbacterium dauci]|uniref:DUF1992 domain-containing protein n=1 Tax=Microbacterium dauci TaxID=3048008 RepID=A0ABT6ZEK5_9MICO|nr:DUF1992 domain-containing protein [Microbacterium sp. LX3-4]MDJ1114593.1 DUF1992 domain-containing protein [Microbacterium sp. LX3-4]